MDYAGKAVIYQIRNTHTGAFYVGSTIHVDTRWRTHRRKLIAGVHHCPHLQAAWGKYGSEAFEFKVVQVVADPSALLAEEQKWLDTHHGTKLCYNYAKYVDSSARGIKFKAEHRAAISEGLRRHYASNPAPFTGRTHSEDTKRKISEAKQGVPKSEAHKQKLREARMGTKASEETRSKLSAMRKGVEKSPEWIAKYHKPVLEVTSGVEYQSLKAVKEAIGISAGGLNEALKSGKPIAKGKFKGLQFRYAGLQTPDVP